MAYKVHDYVRIVADNDWNGLVGIVREVDRGVLHVVCVQKPGSIYFVTRENIGDIEPFA